MVRLGDDGGSREKKGDLMMTSRPYDRYEQPSRWERPALASGIVFAVLQIAAFVFATVLSWPKSPSERPAKALLL